jgi:hypothetical protein
MCHHYTAFLQRVGNTHVNGAYSLRPLLVGTTIKKTSEISLMSIVVTVIFQKKHDCIISHHEETVENLTSYRRFYWKSKPK